MILNITITFISKARLPSGCVNGPVTPELIIFAIQPPSENVCLK